MRSGWRSAIGSLEPGKRADLIVVSMSAARQTPMYDPLSHLVYVTRGDDVRTTIVNGKVLMRDRQMLTLDERAVLAEATAVDGQGAGRRGGKGLIMGLTTLIAADDIQARIRELAARDRSATTRPARKSTWSASSRAASCSWRISCAR